MPENKNSPNEENNAQYNNNNDPEKPPANEKFFFSLWSEIKEYIEKQNARNKEESEANRKIIDELIKSRKKIFWEKYSTIIQVVLAFLNLVMIGIFILSMSNQSWSTKEALKRADSANFYTRQSNDIMKENSITDLRAYVVIGEKSANLESPDNRKEFESYYNIDNVGKTPATNIICFDTIIKSGDTSKIGKAYIVILNKLHKANNGGYVLGSNNPQFKINAYTKTVTLNSQYVQPGTNWNHCLLVGIQYFDIFGKKHRTFGCFLLIPSEVHYIGYSSYNWMN